MKEYMTYENTYQEMRRRRNLKADNPDSVTHYDYQIAVNRLFMSALSLLLLAASVASIGILQTLFNLLTMAAIFVAIVAVAGITFSITKMLIDIFHWLTAGLLE